jgi:hypothetical protein
VIASHSRHDKHANLSHPSLGKYVRLKSVKKYKDTLFAWNVIETDGKYSASPYRSKSLGYQLTPEANESDAVQYSLQTDSARKRFHRRRIEISKRRYSDPLHQQLWESLSDVKIDRKRADREIAGLRAKGKCVIGACAARDSIEMEHFRLTQCDYGRIHTNITNLNSELRKSLTYDGESLAEADIKCSQPTLIAGMIPRSTPDARLYVSLCEDGTLYEFLMAETKNPDRVEVKKGVMPYLFGTNTTTDIAQVFQRCFPSVFDFIKQEKAGTGFMPYTRFAHKCQRLESKIVIETACQTLFDENRGIRLLTVHDSIIVKRQFLKKAEKAITEAFVKTIGVRPQIEIETL